jgi:uroporphyrinogen III methyltransferase/synthase
VRLGSVYLVGAGPGDPGLLTVRGRELLRAADVVVYDRLVDPRLLDEVPPDGLRVFVGKRAGDHCRPQAEINALLIAHARRGRRVVRLKGGDPFVFGRGGEEAEALAEAGVPFEVVPGVSSAVAVPAYAGIPLTHRGYASSFTVVTGHEDGDKNGPGVDWGRLAAAADTLVVLMGVRALSAIVAELLAHGRASDTPVALVRWGTTSAQETVTGTLTDIVDRARAAELTPPVVIVIGEVVRLRERLRWFETASSAGGLKELDGVARGVVEHDLGAAGTPDDLVPEPEPRAAKALDFGSDVVHHELDTVPPARLGLAAVGHGPSG